MRREALLVRRGMLCTLKKKLVRKFYKHVFAGKVCHGRCERLTLGMVG